ncbi:MAG: peptidase M22 [Oscillospiraceae bacterium]|nr:peptidase M22 [Oscillospiraceae bacterium]
MAYYLGLDTSNYTTSVAVYDTGFNKILQVKKLLPVKSGQKGLRQSDAVFHHTVQLPEVLGQLDVSGIKFSGIGVSVRPRNVEYSYMPCFLCGQSAARMFGHVLRVPVYETSHQTGHILAALYSSGRLFWRNQNFLAFHVSGGTTDCVVCEPDTENMLQIRSVSSSLDLKAGQLIDRVGIMLGLHFPCGAELEQLAMQSTKTFVYKPVMKDLNCCMSGLENQCRKLYQENMPICDVAMFCLTAIAEILKAMTDLALAQEKSKSVLYAGGVMSNCYLQKKLSDCFASRSGVELAFAEPTFSCDNAAGTAIYAAIHDSDFAY